MCIKRAREYILKEKLAETNRSCLYTGVRIDNMDGLIYALKEYKSDIPEQNTLLYEKKITQIIENYAPMSIVIPIFDTIDFEGKQYAVMQFKKHGLFLKQVIEELEVKYGIGKIPLNIIFSIIKEVLMSLSVLHNFKHKEQTGILHLDLHPGNIFMESIDIAQGRVGSAKFIDFSSALGMDENGVAYKEKADISITPGYCAPEHLYREENYNASTDLYAVAAICYRMITGIVIRDIFASYGELLENEMYTGENPIIGYMLKAFFKCALESNPKYRYSSAKNMLRAVENLEKCYWAYREHNYYDVLSVAYKMLIPNNKIDLSKIVFKRDTFENAVQQLERDLLQRDIDVKKCYYIFEQLWKLGNVHKNSLTNKIWCNLICSGIACCNHVSKHNQVLELYNLVEKKYKRNMPIMDYLNLRNRIAVIYEDLCQYEKAYDIIMQNIDLLGRLKETYKDMGKLNSITSEEAVRVITLGRAYSAAGRYMTLLHKKNPMDMFKKALIEFGDDEDNRKITISHILHYAIQRKEKIIYEKYFPEYFKEVKGIVKSEDKWAENISVLLLYMNLNKRINLYELYVFLKGIYTFYLDKLDEKMLKSIQEIGKQDILKQMTQHPVELVYKYIALILYEKAVQNKDKGMQFQAEQFLISSIYSISEGKIDLNENLNITMVITYQTTYLYNKLTNQEEDNIELFKLLQKHCHLSDSDWSALENKLTEETVVGQLLEEEFC